MEHSKNNVAEPIEILLVEDSPSDIMMTREALDYAKVINKLHVVDNGIDAMDFLFRKGKFSDAPRPGLILLDLNLPKKNGMEVLADIKKNVSLKTIPVVILTTSKTDEDISKSYGLYANSYIQKPVGFEKFSEVIRTLNSYWFAVVTLPPQSM